MSCEICRSVPKRVIRHHISHKPELILRICRRCHALITWWLPWYVTTRPDYRKLVSLEEKREIAEALSRLEKGEIGISEAQKLLFHTTRQILKRIPIGEVPERYRVVREDYIEGLMVERNPEEVKKWYIEKIEELMEEYEAEWTKEAS